MANCPATWHYQHGITGRMGYTQHLIRSRCAFSRCNGVWQLSNGGPGHADPILWDEAGKVAAIAKAAASF